MKFLIFSGTTEGKIIWEYLKKAGADRAVFVATEYGSCVMPEESKSEVFVGRLDKEAMKRLFRKVREAVIIDATHPYATEVSANLREACLASKRPYLRFIRPSYNMGKAREFIDVRSAAEYLSAVEGNILLTTGSKDLDIFTSVKDYQSRIYPRILPAAEGLERCLALGYCAKNIICMQGPFSTDVNASMIAMTGARYIVTKDTGKAGGFGEKLEAAKIAGIEAVVIKRPEEDDGYDFNGLKKVLFEKFGIEYNGSDEAGEERLPKRNFNLRYPFFIDLTGREILIVGGGKVAERRIKSLLGYGAKITVIAPQISIFIKNEAENGSLKLVLEEYSDEYLNNDYFMAISATDNADLNKKIGEEARSLGILVNVASDASLSEFFFPALISGSGIIGGIISENGQEHALTVKAAEGLRKFLAKKDKF